jgi:hypothetical protein
MDEEMAQCNDGDDGERWPACPLLRRIDRQVNGNGQPGIVQQIGEIHDWVTYQRGLEEGMVKARRRAKVTANIVRAIGVALLGFLSWAGKEAWDVVAPPAAAIIREYWDHHPSLATPPKLGQSEPATAHNTAAPQMAHE